MVDAMMTNVVGKNKVELLSVRGEVQTWVTDCTSIAEAEKTLAMWGYKKVSNQMWAK